MKKKSLLLSGFEVVKPLDGGTPSIRSVHYYRVGAVCLVKRGARFYERDARKIFKTRGAAVRSLKPRRVWGFAEYTSRLVSGFLIGPFTVGRPARLERKGMSTYVQHAFLTRRAALARKIAETRRACTRSERQTATYRRELARLRDRFQKETGQ